MVKLFNRAVNGIYILIIVLLLVYIGFRYTDKIEIYNVTTGSMEEDIHRGDYILIYKKNGSYKVGDVVTFQINDYFVTHRIVKMEDDYVTTKGDANNTEDAKINKKAIIGKVIIAGGILNIIINYKFSIVAVLLAVYLFSCYLGNGNEKKAINGENDDEMASLDEPGELENETNNDDKQENKDDSVTSDEETIEIEEEKNDKESETEEESVEGSKKENKKVSTKKKTVKNNK